MVYHNITSWCFRWLKSPGICLAGEERMRATLPLVDKVVQLLDENER